MPDARNDLARHRHRIVFPAAGGAHVNAYLRVAFVDEERSASSPRRLVPRPWHFADALGKALEHSAHHAAASPIHEHGDVSSILAAVHALFAGNIWRVGAVARAERGNRERADVRLRILCREQCAGILRLASARADLLSAMGRR